MFAALDPALVGTLEGGVDGDDPTWTRHLQLQIGVVGDGHELCITWTSQDGVCRRNMVDSPSRGMPMMVDCR